MQEAIPSLDLTTPQVVTTYNARYVQYNEKSSYLAPDGSAYGAYNLSLLDPGIAFNPGVSPARGVIVGGQRPWSNNFSIDGVDNNSRLSPGPLLYVPNEASTEEFTLRNQFPPEWGHTLGGQFNTIARTGTNQFHGALYWYSQNKNLNATDQRNAAAGLSDARFDQNRIGANFGLPIIANKLFFFGDFEYIPLGYDTVPGAPIYVPTAAGYSALAGLSGVSQTNVSALQTFAGTAATQTGVANVNGRTVPVGLLNTGFRQYQNRYVGAGSLDWNISNTDQVRARYFHNTTNANNDGAVLPAFYSPESDRALMASISEYHNFTPVMINELRLGYSRFDSSIHNNGLTFAGLALFPSLYLQDLNLQLGAGALAGVTTFENSYQISDNVSLNVGRHTFKFGAEGRHFIGPILAAPLGIGSQGFTSLNQFLTTPASMIGSTAARSALSYPGNNWDVLVYVNDTWRMSPNFTVNLGVRWSYATLPSVVDQQVLNANASVSPGLVFRSPDTQKTAFGPVVGFAYSPGFVKNSVFRAGFGMNYDTTYQNMMVPSLPSGGSLQLNSTGLSTIQARALTSTYFSDQRLPYSMQWNASWQQQLSGFVLDLTYLGVKTVHLPTETTLNSVSPVSATTNLPLFYSQPSQATLNSLPTTLSGLQAASAGSFTSSGFTSPLYTTQPNGFSWYNGLQIEGRQRFAGGFQVALSYTWSHLIDNLSGPLYNSAGFYSLAETQVPSGTSFYDRRHHANATVLWDVSGIGKNSFNWVRDIVANMNFGFTYSYESPERLPLTSGVNADLTGLSNAGVIVNPNGIAGTGSGVSPLTNSSGQVVGYLASNPTAQYVAAAPGLFVGSGRQYLTANDVQNFDASLFKRFAVRDSFSLEFFGQAYNIFNHPQFTAAAIHSIAANPANYGALLNPASLAFGSIGATLPSNARTLQVGARFLF